MTHDQRFKVEKFSFGNRSGFSSFRGKEHDLATPVRVCWLALPFQTGRELSHWAQILLAHLAQLLYQARHCGHLRIPSLFLTQWTRGWKPRCWEIPFLLVADVAGSAPTAAFPGAEVTAWKCLADTYYKTAFSILEGAVLHSGDQGGSCKDVRPLFPQLASLSGLLTQYLM